MRGGSFIASATRTRCGVTWAAATCGGLHGGALRRLRAVGRASRVKLLVASAEDDDRGVLTRRLREVDVGRQAHVAVNGHALVCEKVAAQPLTPEACGRPLRVLILIQRAPHRDQVVEERAHGSRERRVRAGKRSGRARTRRTRQVQSRSVPTAGRRHTHGFRGQFPSRPLHPFARAAATTGVATDLEGARRLGNDAVAALRAANEALLQPLAEAQVAEAAARLKVSREEAKKLVNARWE